MEKLRKVAPRTAAVFLVSSVVNTPPSGAVELLIEPSVGISQAYDDNVFGTTAGQKKDTITSVEPTISLNLKSSTFRQTLSYSAVLEHYWRTQQEDATSHLGSYRAVWEADPRVTLDVQERLSYAPFTSTEIFPEGAAEPQFTRIRRLRNATDVTPRFALTERTALRFQSEFFVQNYYQTASAAASNPANAESKEFSELVSVDHRLSLRDTLSPQVSFNRYWFRQLPDATSVGADFSWERRWTEDLSTTLAAGALETLQGGGLGHTTNFVGAASGTYRLKPWNFRIGYLRDVSAGSGFGRALIQDTVTAGVDVTPTEGWSLHVDQGYFHSASMGSGTGVHLNGFFVASGITYAFPKWVALSMSYNYRIQDAQGGIGSNFQRNLAYMTLGIIPPVSPITH